jgi:hypothetical protein
LYLYSRTSSRVCGRSAHQQLRLNHLLEHGTPDQEGEQSASHQPAHPQFIRGAGDAPSEVGGGHGAYYLASGRPRAQTIAYIHNLVTCAFVSNGMSSPSLPADNRSSAKGVPASLFCSHGRGGGKNKDEGRAACCGSKSPS